MQLNTVGMSGGGEDGSAESCGDQEECGGGDPKDCSSPAETDQDEREGRGEYEC